MKGAIIASLFCALAAASPLATEGQSLLRAPPGVKVSGTYGSPKDGLTEDLPAGQANDPQIAGTGCAEGTTYSSLSENGTVLTVLFDSFQAQISHEVGRPDHRRFCTVKIDMTVPVGYRFAVNYIDWQGYVSLDQGVTANFHSKYFFDDTKRAASLSNDVHGPSVQNYVYHGDAASKPEYTPCTGHDQTSFNINTAISLHYAGRAAAGNHDPKGLITVDSLDTKIKQVLNLDWQKCPGYKGP